MSPRVRPLADRALSQPARSRLPLGHVRRAEILTAHGAAMTAGRAGYSDPATGLFVLTAAWLAARGTCCDNGCRHCPYIPDIPCGCELAAD
ncbi:MAG: hypothetical protein NVS3B26_08250 [Mycobacteriales bacterium]